MQDVFPIFNGNIWKFIMNNLRKVKDDILKGWIEFREETLSGMSEEDKKILSISMKSHKEF